jgi:hypothetical protein
VPLTSYSTLSSPQSLFCVYFECQSSSCFSVTTLRFVPLVSLLFKPPSRDPCGILFPSPQGPYKSPRDPVPIRSSSSLLQCAPDQRNWAEVVISLDFHEGGYRRSPKDAELPSPLLSNSSHQHSPRHLFPRSPAAICVKLARRQRSHEFVGAAHHEEKPSLMPSFP